MKVEQVDPTTIAEGPLWIGEIPHLHLCVQARSRGVHYNLFHRETGAQHGKLCRHIHWQRQKSAGGKLKSLPFECSQVRWALRAATADQHQVHVAAFDSERLPY